MSCSARAGQGPTNGPVGALPVSVPHEARSHRAFSDSHPRLHLVGAFEAARCRVGPSRTHDLRRRAIEVPAHGPGSFSNGRSQAQSSEQHKQEQRGQVPHSQMLINYVPGEECRVAIVEDGKLEELPAQRALRHTPTTSATSTSARS